MDDLITQSPPTKLITLQNNFIQGNTIYVAPGNYNMSRRKLDTYKNIALLQRYYQCNPLRFIGDFFNIELFDFQAWIIQRAWNCPNVLVVASRG